MNVMETMESINEDFDESNYLKLNPDVRDAVQKGNVSSGKEHCLLYGCQENRPGIPSNIMKQVMKFYKVMDSLPVPPPDLRKRVHGEENRLSFDIIGNIVSHNIYAAVKSEAIQLSEHSRILDFGCGCGRIMRWLQPLYDSSVFYGTDIDAEAISWCQDNLSNIGKFLTNEEQPSLPFSDNFFDFVYSISIFTHLPEDMQFAWLKELRRVVKNDGYLLLTVHGEELFPAKPRKAKKQFLKTGFYYAIGHGTDGLPDFYQTSFHTEKYIHQHWSNFFEIIGIIKKGIAGNQDLILCKKVR